jgi:hypothetical protein
MTGFTNHVGGLVSKNDTARDAEIRRLLSAMKKQGKGSSATDAQWSNTVDALLVVPAGTVQGLLTKLLWAIDYRIGEDADDTEAFLRQVIADIKRLASEVRP